MSSALPDPATLEDRKARTRAWFETLRDEICGAFESLERDAPELIAPYVAMARATLDLAERSGRLPSGSRGEVEDVLDRWS